MTEANVPPSDTAYEHTPANAGLSPVEQEAIILAAVYGLIEGMVNHELVEPCDPNGPTMLWFRSSSHKRLFSILFGDFLALPRPRKGKRRPFGLEEPAAGPATNRTYLGPLERIARNPLISNDASALLAIVSEFAAWLNGDAVCEDVWLPGLKIKFDMTMPRIVLFQTVADLSKHNFSRLEDRVRQLREMLALHGHQVDERLIYIELPVFQEWLYDHLFSYHATTIGEYLNNIRWAIYVYLKPEFERAFRQEPDSIFYTFDVPAIITDDLAYAVYWELMNHMRGFPNYPPFVATPSLKGRF